MTHTLKRCAKCYFPSNYPGTVFHDDLCRHCSGGIEKPVHTPQPSYSGMEALQKDIVGKKSNLHASSDQYDCILSYSGGRDSSFLLYLLVEELNLNVLPVMAYHQYVPEQTWVNVKRISEKLKVEVLPVENKHLNKCSPHFLKAWKFNPLPETIQTICTGCLYGYYKITMEIAKAHRIPVIIFGENPYEWTRELLRLALLKIDQDKIDQVNFQTLLQVLKNPMLLSSFTGVRTFIKELPWFFNRDKLFKENGINCIQPFFKYIEWQESELNQVLEKIGWDYERKMKDPWGSDCYIKVIQQYFYHKTMGFNDRDIFTSEQIRDGSITLEEGIGRLKVQNQFSKDYVKTIMQDYYGYNYADYEQKLNKRYPQFA